MYIVNVPRLDETVVLRYEDNARQLADAFDVEYKEYDGYIRYWYEFHDNVASLTRYMADRDMPTPVSEIVHAVEKPWKYETEFVEAIVDEWNRE